MKNELTFSDLMYKAIEMITPYLPDMHEIDDYAYSDDQIRIRVFDASNIGPLFCKPVDEFWFTRNQWENYDEMIERFMEEVHRYCESWLELS